MSITCSHFPNMTLENGALGTDVHLDYSFLFHQRAIYGGAAMILDGVSRVGWNFAGLCSDVSNSKREKMSTPSHS